MKPEIYTPGHDNNATDFMARRTIESHGVFFMPHLDPGVSVLDCGCGPGSITLGIATRTAPGEVIGMDIEPSQIERAIDGATRQRLGNVRFDTADCRSLPFPDATFDRVFSHALLKHLVDPVTLLREWHRVLKPAGVIGVCSPDWGGFILTPPSPKLTQAIEAYMTIQMKSGGDVTVGRKLGRHLSAAGFESVRMSARYECYPSPDLIGEYLAVRLEREGNEHSANVLRAWSHEDAAMFAQAWISAVAIKS